MTTRKRPVLECCEPYMRPFPSGWKWIHSRKCKRYPGQTVGDERDPRRGLEGSIERHPASGDLQVAHWDAHPDHDPATCEACGYVDAHVDDGDTDPDLEVVERA